MDINKWYVSNLSENQDSTLNGTYKILDGKMNNIDIPVTGDKPSTGELHYTSNTLQGGCLVIGEYEVVFTGSSISSTNKGDCSTYSFFSIGDTVNYSTSLNEVNLTNWKVFYIDEDFIYLILGDALPNSAIDYSDIYKKDTYAIYGGYGQRANLINFLTNKSNWNELLIGTLNETINIDETQNEDAWAMGSPTLELFRDSWNTNDGYPTLYIVQDSEASSDGLYGYNIGTTPEADNYRLKVSNDEIAWNDVLYFPTGGKNGNYDGYWLSSPVRTDSGYLGSIDWYKDNSSSIGLDTFRVDGNFMYSRQTFSIRPIIKLPTSIINQ